MQRLIRDIPVYYKEVGNGIPVIALHGYTVDHRLMTGCMEPLFTKRAGWQRIYPDLPGMGMTPGSAQINDSDDMLEVIIEFIEDVIPGEKFLLVGESYGGYLAQA